MLSQQLTHISQENEERIFNFLKVRKQKMLLAMCLSHFKI